MSQTISSAEPLKLLRYSDTMALVDDALGAEANRLGAALVHFEATCREPAFRLHVSQAADALIQYGQQARGTDLWVRDVAVGFQLADGGGMYGPVANAPICLLPVYASRAAVNLPDESEEAIRQWLEQNQGKYSSFEEWQQALIARFPYLIVAMNLTADEWHRIFDSGNQARMTIDDSLKILRYLKVREGYTYPGQKILSGGHSIKELAGWSENLTHLRFPNALQVTELVTSHNVWNLVGKSTWHEVKGALIPTTKASWVLFIAGVAISSIENWREYHDEGGSKVVSGTVADTAIDLKYIAIGTGVGAVIGGGIGAFGGPAGLVLGAKIGGFAGSIAGGFYAAHKKETSDEDEILTNRVDKNLPDFIDKGLDAAGNKLDDALKFIDDTLTPPIQNIIKLF